MLAFSSDPELESESALGEKNVSVPIEWKPIRNTKNKRKEKNIPEQVCVVDGTWEVLSW